MHTAVVRDDIILDWSQNLIMVKVIQDVNLSYVLCLCFPCLKFYEKSLLPFDEHSVTIIILFYISTTSFLLEQEFAGYSLAFLGSGICVFDGDKSWLYRFALLHCMLCA